MAAGVSERSEETFSNFRSGLTLVLRSVFEADDPVRVTAPDYPLMNQFKQLYCKVKRAFPDDVQSIVVDELRLRLNFMVEATDHNDCRQSVFSFVVMVALILYREGDNTLMYFLAEYCDTLRECDEPSVRINICYLAGLVFNNWPAVMKGRADMWDDENLEPDLRDVFYEVFERRRRDRNCDVRAAVTHAVSQFQHIKFPKSFKKARDLSPHSIIHHGLRDKECTARLEAIKRVDTRSTDFDYVVELAMSDKVQAVRKQAIKVLGNINPALLNNQQILALLKCTLTDVDTTMSEFTKENLLAPWLVLLSRRVKKKENRSSEDVTDTKTGLGPAVGKLMAKVDWVANQKDAALIMFRCLDIVRRLIARDEKMSLPDIIKVLVEDTNEPRLMCWSNQKKIKECTTADNMSIRVFMWRCCIEYCSELTGKAYNHGRVDERVRDQCFKRLAQPLKDSCETVFHMWQWKGNIVKEIHDKKLRIKFTAEDENCHNAALLEGLRVLTHLERDPSGMEKWKMLLESMLEDVTLSKPVTDFIGDCLVKIHYNDPDEAMKAVLGRINDLVLKEVDLEEIKDDADPTSDELCTFKIQLVSGLMKTGKFKTMNPYLQDIARNLVGRCLQTQMKPDAHANAMEVISIMCLMDESVAIQYLNFIWVGFSTGGTSADIKRVCLCIFCDLVIKYGYDNVVIWRSNIYESRLIEVFIEILRDHDTPLDIAFKASECAAKMLLLDDRDPEERHWVRLCSALIMRLFHSKSIIDCRLKTCITQFALIFCANSRSNQMLMVNCLFEIIESYATESHIKFVRSIIIRRAALSMCEWVSEDVLTSKARMMEEAKVHHLLLLRIIEHVAVNAKTEPDLALFTLCAASLDVKTIPAKSVEEVQKKLTQAYDAVCAAYNNKVHPAKNLVKIQKKIDATFGVSDDDSSNTVDVKRIPTGLMKPRTTRLPSSSNSKRSRLSPEELVDPSSVKKTRQLSE